MRIVLDPWGGDYGSQVATSHEVDTEETVVHALEADGEECPWKPINPDPTILPRETIVTEMRRAEAQVAEARSGSDNLVLADGSLKFFGGASAVVGVIKTIYKLYLPAKRATILARLQAGQRTPFFCIEGKRKNTGY